MPRGICGCEESGVLGGRPEASLPWGCRTGIHRAVAGRETARDSVPGQGRGGMHGQPFVLVGLDAIGRAVGAGQGAVKRWIREDGFPARRCSDGTYRADPDAVRRWFWGGHEATPCGVYHPGSAAENSSGTVGDGIAHSARGDGPGRGH